MRALTWPQVIARRLARSHLLDPAPRDRLVEVVRDVGLVQAQVLSAAEIGIGVRVRDVTAADVRRELYERRSLVKTWALRGTLHLVPAGEAALWAAAVRGPEPYWESDDWLARHDLDRERSGALFDAIADALEGDCLTRAELAESVTERLGWRHPRLLSPWGELLGPPALLGMLCFGPPRGGEVTFVRADEWTGGRHEHDPADARRAVLRRYLTAYGPAKPDDFRRWSGFDRSAVRGLFEELRDELEEVRVDGTRAWMLGGDDGDLDRDAAGLRLLPQYDAYVIGFRPREQLVPEAVRDRIRADPKGRWESVTGVSPLLVDGVAGGLWRRSSRGARVSIEVEPAVPLARGRKRELEAAVARVRAIVEG